MANRTYSDIPVLAGKPWELASKELQDFLWRFTSATSTVSEHNDLDGRSELDVHPADSITNTPTGPLSSTTLQSAVDELASQTFTKEASLVDNAGLAAGANLIVWYAPFACEVLNVRGYRVGGTGATINARLNGASNHLAADKSLTSADAWMDGGAVQNITYAAGDKLEVLIVTVTANPTQVAVQVVFRRV